jgi:hypothetical protein
MASDQSFVDFIVDQIECDGMLTLRLGKKPEFSAIPQDLML